MIDENTTVKFHARQNIREIINLVRSGMPICVAEVEGIGLTMVIPSVQDVTITYEGLTYTVDCFMMKFSDPLLYDGITMKRHWWTIYVKGEFVAGE